MNFFKEQSDLVQSEGTKISDEKNTTYKGTKMNSILKETVLGRLSRETDSSLRQQRLAPAETQFSEFDQSSDESSDITASSVDKFYGQEEGS